MKITCDNCGAKYSIADEKVRGKVFKIRCKKCSHIVVVRGTGGDSDDVAAEPAAAVAQVAQPDPPAGDDAVWHLVVGREQVGPCSAEEVRRRFAVGDINADSYIWREGFADWLRLSTVDEFADLVHSSVEAVAAVAAMGAVESLGRAAAGAGSVVEERAEAPVAQFSASAAAAASGGGAAMFTGASSVSGAAEAPAPSSRGNGQSGLFGAAGAGATHRSMFGEAEADDGGDLAHPQMTGQRGENSVLFSLANLQALAMGEGKPAAASTGAVSARSAGGEGSSGLIDIRAMAAATSTSPRAVDDDLPSLGGFGSPVAAAPVLLPSAASDRPPWLLPVLIGLGAVLVLTLVLLVVLLTRETPPTQTAPAENSAAAATGTEGEKPAADRQAPAQAGTAAGGEALASARKAAEEPGRAGESTTKEGDDRSTDREAAAADSAEEKARDRRAPRRRRGAGSSRAAAADTPAPAPAPAPRRPQQGPRDELDQLLDSSMGSRRGGRSPAPSSAGAARNSNLPPQLSRAQIVSGMRSVMTRVQACYDRYKVPGLAEVRLKIENNGRVKSALVKGLFAGTPTGSCVQSAVMAARFPEFQTSSMSITYPFMLR